VNEHTSALLPDSPLSLTDDRPKLKGADLVNLLHYINFKEGSIIAGFRHPKTGRTRAFPASPQPTLDDTMECRWSSPGLPALVLNEYEFQEFTVTDGEDFIAVAPEVQTLDRDHIVFRVPEFVYQKEARRIQRYPTPGVAATVFQAGLRFEGQLVDFAAVSFHISLTGSRHGLNLESPVAVHLEKDGRLWYTGECRIIRSSGPGRPLVVDPLVQNFSRFRAKKFRSLRQVLHPAPQLGFVHPLTGRRVSLPVADLSGVGLAVEEAPGESALLPGMVLGPLTLEIGHQFLLRCEGQVLYRNVVEAEAGKPVVRCGVVFLDLALEDQIGLAALLHQSMNHRLRVSSAVDMEELWRFFFESGFLYPSKYVAIEASKAEFKKVYETLYLKSPSLARHFLFEEKGTLFAHMAMLRAYPQSWLIHHHAASKKTGFALAGVAVLDQIGHYINEFHVHKSSHMDYVMCYYRRENKFPHRVFGGTFKDVQDPKGISLDEFAYLTLDEGSWEDAPAALQFLPVSQDDLGELERFYEHASGGLALDAMNLRHPLFSDDERKALYRDLGLRCESYVYSVKLAGRLQAVVTVQLSELGINLSNLTNCVHAFVLESELPAAALLSGLRTLVSQHTAEVLPLLVYPASYLGDQHVDSDKNYTLWVLNMTHLDGYFLSLQKRFKRGGDGSSS
jgi:hypothetical protein